MLTMTKIACPHCGAVLKSSKAMRAGKHLQCVKCQAPFTVSAADVIGVDTTGACAPGPASDGSHGETTPNLEAVANPASDLGHSEVPRMGLLEPAFKRDDWAMTVAAGTLASSATASSATASSATASSAMASGPDPTLPPQPVPRVDFLAGAFRSLPLPRHADTPVAELPRKSAVPAVLACAAVVLILAGGVTLAITCFSDPSPRSDESIANGPSVGDVKISVPKKKDAGGSEDLPRADPSGADPSPSGDRDKVRPKPAPADGKKGAPPGDVREPGPEFRRPELPPDLPPAVAVAQKEGPPPHPQQQWINEAIDKGVAYLKAHQLLGGGWMEREGQHAVGFAALPGLTLLECGVKPRDEAVQKAAKFVRNPRNIDTLDQTYDLALAILFLDRLGEARDRALIQKLALRLVGGQTAAGGWTYQSRVLTPKESLQLLTYLQQNRPKALLNPIHKPGGKDDLKNPLRKGGPDGLPNPLPGKDSSDLKNPIQQPEGDKARLAAKPGEPSLIPPLQEKPAEAPAAEKPKVKPRPPAQRVPRPSFLPDPKNPVIVQGGRGKRFALRGGSGDDNSNSQFAMLALWAARRHDVPTEATLALAEKRYLATQNADGGWGYHTFGFMKETQPAMTGVGLLGLAMGHGASEQARLAAAKANKKPAKAKEDIAIQSGLRKFGKFIGEPARARPPMENLYFLWTVERVAMLYNLKTIGGKDWYGWGVTVLLPNQGEDGSWRSAAYPGHNPFTMSTVDTCFALLFLKRSNLVQDLTENLRLYMAITDPDSKK